MKHFAIALILTFLISESLIAQTTAAPKTKAQTELDAQELDAFQKQATQLIKFMEFSFNTLGSSKTEYRDKDIIINQSYLKYFKDAKVQIEDDLVGNRDVVTNKDVQAYLKDIDFFFKEAVFKFTIEDITSEVNDNGEPFFKIKTSRNLTGTTLEGVAVSENRARYIEINLDPASRDLKIVSMYTTRSSEEQEIISWWNNLEPAWRDFFSGETLLPDGMKMRSILAVGTDFIVVDTGERKPASSDTGEISGSNSLQVQTIHISDSILSVDTLNHISVADQSAKVPDFIYVGDTLRMSSASLLVEVRKLWRLEQLDLSGVKGIVNLEPLSAFTMLKQLNVMGRRVSDLGPIRNLSKLETLIASSTLITDLSPIQYTNGLRYLDISSTPVADISNLSNFKLLEFLDLSDTKVRSLDVLNDLQAMRELRIARLPLQSLQGVSNHASLRILDMTGLKISDFSLLTGLDVLNRIVLTQTQIDDLSILPTMQALEYVYLDYTQVSDIKPLLELPELKAVYCDKTLVDKQAALAFIQARPDVKVIYESEQLSVWWGTLSGEWKSVFRKLVEVSDTASREELYEVSNLRKVDISGNKAIQDLSPLSMLPSLSSLDASETSIKSLAEIKNSPDLREINVSQTAVSDIKPLANLTGLISLNISNTEVNDLSPLSNLWNLKLLRMDNVPVDDASIILRLKRLERLYADGVPAVAKVAEKVYDSIPGLLLVFQTEELLKWWDALPQSWKQVFAKIEPHTGTPDRDQLHRIVSVEELDLTRDMSINSLSPVSQLKKLKILRFPGIPVSDLLPVGLILRLKELDCSNTPVSDLSPITTHRGLSMLNCSNTQVKDLKPIGVLTNISILDISGTQVKSLTPLSSLTKLTQLIAFNTRISNLKPISELRSLQLLRIYNSKVSGKKIDKFKSDMPKVEVVYY